jgi:hypothetical protein
VDCRRKSRGIFIFFVEYLFRRLQILMTFMCFIYTKGRKRRRRKKKKKKHGERGHLKEFEKFSSGSDSNEDVEEEEEVDDAHVVDEHDDNLFRSDHEFSCESDVPDEEAAPIQVRLRARRL